MTKKQLKFEDALQKLESIVDELEGGELKLEDALARFEEGVRLATLCGKQLETAEQKVRYLLEESDRQPAKADGADDTEETPDPAE